MWRGGAYEVADPTYVSFHSRSFCSGSRHSNVISNSYGALNGAGLLRTVTLRSDTVAIMLVWSEVE
jgi:hypothetical protein